MRFVVDRNAMLRALGHITGIVERRNTIPILSNILIGADRDGGLTFKATDLDMEAVEAVPAKVEVTGAVTVPAHTLHDIVRKLPDGAEIRIERKGEEGRLKVAAGRASFELAILPADDFPDMGQTELPTCFTVDSGELKRLFEKARFAISTEETRYYLNGIYLHAVDGPEGGKLRAVATDGHRLAQVETACPGGAAGMPGVIVPRKAVGEVIKLLESGAAPVEVTLSPAKIRFAVGDVVLTSKLIDGSFPDYARVIPTTNKKLLSLENADLVKAVDRVSTLSSEKGRAVKLNAAEGRLVVSANNPESGSATEEISAEYQDEPLEIGFNARYLLDITGQIDGTKALFKLADGSSPTLISDETDASALYVLMPMRV
ncbi:DNA polymerase III subunit beta [Rhodomicrobium vannielii ATCC 17100]|uniref:DNA polymerase III subunit beta n=1 Tax=Rhodomicrobium vannielii TaxID=1069 RepID=UPI0019192942|nr:DNA polymerase III subunit beta [Rhodomicrobium vannielii]MBJ7534057.1 DNA polymerase III subunit beta [Rhodomicrobium vannielii ATCC 17100]